MLLPDWVVTRVLMMVELNLLKEDVFQMWEYVRAEKEQTEDRRSGGHKAARGYIPERIYPLPLKLRWSPADSIFPNSLTWLG